MQLPPPTQAKTDCATFQGYVEHCAYSAMRQAGPASNSAKPVQMSGLGALRGKACKEAVTWAGERRGDGTDSSRGHPKQRNVGGGVRAGK